MRPPEPGLLEPYDLPRQFDVLRALEGTAVRAPRALWLEPSGDVLGRPFFVMERVDGEIYERDVPRTIAPERVRRMTETALTALQEQLRTPAGFASYGHIRTWLAEQHQVQLSYSSVYALVHGELRAKPKRPRPSHEKKVRTPCRSSRPPCPLSSPSSSLAIATGCP